MSDILDALTQAVLDYDTEAAGSLAREAMTAGLDPLAALDALTSAIRTVGEEFGRGELWLPDLLGASDAMLAATPILEAEIAARGTSRRSTGTVVIGTVQGDLHNIGKAMVCTMLTAEGLHVHDLGVNVSADQFLQAVREHRPDILAMSALMTTTISQQRLVIERLVAEGLRDQVKVIVGGGGVTQEFAAGIGADGYDATAPGAARLARCLLAPQG